MVECRLRFVNATDEMKLSSGWPEMNDDVVLSKIIVYPIKSLDGCQLAGSSVLSGGALRFDRAWALFDRKGAFVNAKRHPAIHRLRMRLDLDSLTMTLSDESPDGLGSAKFVLESQTADIEEWLSGYFGFPVELKRNDQGGFPDDTDSPGPTVISVATLREVANWFGLSIDETRRRFRANLEIDGVPPFWEDRLFGPTGETVRFKLGSQILEGVNPCQRCAVPTRDSHTGAVNESFVRLFIANRRDQLSPDTPRDRFQHFYKLAINTKPAETISAGAFQIGDRLAIINHAAA